MMKKLKSIKWAAVFLTMAGGAVGYFGAQAGLQASNNLPPVVSFSLFILLVPSFFFVIALHEAGHAFMGIRVHFDFRFYVVGPFMWEKENGEWKFKWNKNINLSGGMVLCLPTDSHNLTKRFALYAAGGPLASLLTSGLFLGLYAILNTTHSSSLLVQLATSWMWILFLLSMVIFVLTAIPFHTNGFSSDGARVFRLYRGGDTAAVEVMLLKVIASSCSGLRPSRLNKAELEASLTLAEKIKAPMGLYFHYYYFYHAFENQQLDLAEEQLTHYLDKADNIPAGLRSSIFLDAAFFYAVGRKDTEKAMHYFSQFKPSALVAKSTILAVEASLAMLKNEKQEAVHLIDKALEEMPKAMDRGIALFIKEKLVTMREGSF